MRIAFATLGCRQNQFETDIMADQARTAGFTPVAFSQPANVYVINTCTVTERADSDSRQLIRRAIRRNPVAFVVVVGCYAQAAPERIAALEGVDLILGNAEKMDLMRHLRSVAWECHDLRTDGTTPRLSVGDIGTVRAFQDAPAPAQPDRTRPFLKIQDGCNFACTFCIIPAVRGPNRSLAPDQVIREAQRLATAGHPEIVLTGINLGTYGWDLRPRASLSALLQRLLDETTVPRIRLSSLHPHEVTPQMVQLLASSSRLCRHMHLAVQSGDDEVLRQMARSYRSAHFREVVTRLDREVPGIAIGVDVIVGFPGETDGAFERTHRLLETLPVSYFHVFTYSRRSGTKAAGMPGQVLDRVKARRNHILRQLGAQKFLAFKRGFVGRSLPVAVLDDRDRDSGLLHGVSDNYLGTLFHGPDAIQGKLVQVEVQDVNARGMLLGRLPGAQPVRLYPSARKLSLLVGG